MNIFSWNNKYLLGFLLVYLAVQIVFFPQFYAAIDEHEYIKNSVLLSQGHFNLAQPAPEYACRANLYTDSGYVSSYFVGKSIFLIPFLLGGINLILASGLVNHLINFFLIILILRKLKINELFSLLYILFPTFVYLSRTLFPELLVLTCFLAGLYFFISEKKKDWLLSGLFFAAAGVVRYDALLGLAAFVIPSLPRNRQKAFTMIAGSILPIIFIFAFNSFVYGGALNTGYGTGAGLLKSLTRGIFDVDLLIYAIILLLFYPLMLASPFISKKFNLKAEYALAIAAYMVLSAAFTTFTAFQFGIGETLTARLRYLVPLIGLLIIPYASFLSEITEKYAKHFKGIFSAPNILVVFFVFMLAGSAYLSSEHSKILGARSDAKEIIYSQTQARSTIIGSSDDCIYFQRGILEERKYYNADLKQDLAANPQNISLEKIDKSNLYILDLSYGYLSGRDSQRNEVINRERQKIKDFIKENKQNLELVYSEEKPNFLSIYRWKT